MNNFFSIVILPPLNVQATQSNPSAPVEISWSPPPIQGGFEITGYRIFYSSGPDNISIPSMLVTSVSFSVNGSYDGQTVAIRSESDQLYSQLVNVTVGKLCYHSTFSVAETVPFVQSLIGHTLNLQKQLWAS